jgi:hypothetical protein
MCANMCFQAIRFTVRGFAITECTFIWFILNMDISVAPKMSATNKTFVTVFTLIRLVIRLYNVSLEKRRTNKIFQEIIMVNFTHLFFNEFLHESSSDLIMFRVNQMFSGMMLCESI